MALERLDKLLAAQGEASRKEAARLIRQGAVKVDGQAVRDPSCKLDPQRAAVEVQGRPLTLKKHIYLMLNKPAGVVSASRDRREATVVDLVPPHLRRRGLFPAGRLDKDTTGFVLITDDGGLAHAILSPRRHVPKTYLVGLDGPVTQAMEEAFARGIPLDGGERCLPARLERLEERTARVVLWEGMYHQIKRMFASCGVRVVQLRRIAMGALPLDEALAEGECRELTQAELELLCQGREDWAQL